MPKVIYKQHFRDAWLQNPEFKDWIRKDISETTKAYCSYCKCSVAAKLHDIKSHASTKKHISVTGSFQQKNKLQYCKQVPTKTSEQEAALSLYVAEHTSIAPIDHLSQLCVQNFKECSAAAKIKLGRTKCTSIISNVLAVHFNEELYKEIGDSSFSLLIDESTDISTTKLVGK